MIEIINNYSSNIILSFLLFFLLLLILFPIKKIISKIPSEKISKNHIILITLLAILLVITKSEPLGTILAFPMTLFSFLIFLFGFLSNRKYIYLLALISLGLTPFMLILKLENIAEFFAQTCYLLLVLGVLKDIFYEKIFE